MGGLAWRSMWERVDPKNWLQTTPGNTNSRSMKIDKCTENKYHEQRCRYRTVAEYIGMTKLINNRYISVVPGTDSTQNTLLLALCICLGDKKKKERKK